MLTNRYSIYVGLNDADDRQQIIQSEELKAIISNTCNHYRVSYTIAAAIGGYWMEAGDFVTENTILINLIGADDTIVKEIAEDVCTFLNQEVVMVVQDQVDCRYIKNDVREDRKKIQAKKR